MKINMYKAVATLALVFTTTALTFAVGTPIPFTFKAGDPAVAEDVNRNFQALADYINALQIKAEPFSQPDDFATVSKVAGLVQGTTVTVAGEARLVWKDLYPSFDPDGPDNYVVITTAPVGFQDFNTEITSYPTFTREELNKTWKKTSVNGYPVVFGVTYSYGMSANEGKMSAAACRFEIRLDEMTYVQYTAFTDGKSVTTQGPWTQDELKAQRTKCQTYAQGLYVDFDNPPVMPPLA